MSQLVARSVAAAYRLGQPTRDPVYADRGELGLIWRLDTDRGAYAVKELHLATAEASAAADVAFQRAAERAGVRLPRPVLTRAGRVLLPGADAGSPAAALRVYEWVDLHDDVVSPEELGAALAALHRVRHPAAGPINAWYAEPLGAEAWRDLLIRSRAAGAPWAPALERWLPDLVAADAAVRPPGRALWTCHLDVNIENVRRTRDGGVVVLDWENSGPALATRELAMAMVDIAEPLGVGAAAAAYGAYRAEGGAHRLTGTADFSTALAVQGHLCRFYVDRALDPGQPAEPTRPDNRARARDRLRRILARPVTTGYIGELMDHLVGKQR